MKKSFFISSLLLALAISFLTPNIKPVLAQESQSRIGISPVTFNLTANPGDTLNQVFKVRNDSAQTRTISIETQNFVAVGEEGGVALTEEDTSFDLASWIQIDQNQVTLDSGEEVQIPYLIRVPGNAEPGGHYASIYAFAGAPTAGSETGSTVGQRIGSLVLLKVAGDVAETASIESFKVKDFEAGNAVPFEIRAKNGGTVHIRPAGFVTITDFRGQKVADLNIEERNIFPGAIRVLDASWDKPGFIGRYTASALMYYGDSNQQLTAVTTFWIIPWMTVGIAAGALLLTILILWFGRRRIGRSLKALVSGK